MSKNESKEKPKQVKIGDMVINQGREVTIITDSGCVIGRVLAYGEYVALLCSDNISLTPVNRIKEIKIHLTDEDALRNVPINTKNT